MKGLTKIKKHIDSFHEEVNKLLDTMNYPIIIEKYKKILEIMKNPLWTKPPQSVEDSFRFGWLRGIALMTDTLLDGRWYEWLRILHNGEMKHPDEMPNNSIKAEANRQSDGLKMLERCMNHVYAAGYRLADFIEWIGYGLGIAWFKKPNIPNRLWGQLYREFNLDLLQMKPADYFSSFVGEHGQKGQLDYFPTPIHVTMAINEMLNFDSKSNRIHSQFEPCVGAAAMLLPSNSLNLVGADLNLTMVKVASIQAFLYMPSMLYVPRPVIGVHADPETLTINKYFEFNTDTRLYWGNSLLGEYQVPRHIFEENSEMVDIYCHSLDLSKHEIFQYEEEMRKPWDSIPYEMKRQIVKAQAREIGWDIMTTNPPFNLNLSQYERDKIRTIKENNQIFLQERQKRELEKNPVIEFMIYDVQLKIAEINKKNKINDGQYEFELV